MTDLPTQVSRLQAMDEQPATTRGDRARWWLRIAVAVVLFLVLLGYAWNWNWLRGPIESRVEAATGRVFLIGGDLHVDLGRVVAIEVRDLSLANPGWAAAPRMAHVAAARLEVPVWPWLKGERYVQRVVLDQPELRLERSEGGEANWQIGKKGGSRGDAWSFGELRIRDGRLFVRDAPFETNLALRVDTRVPDDERQLRMRVEGSGRYRGHPFELDGWADSPAGLIDGSNPAYDVDLSARAGDTKVRAVGALRVPVNPSRFTIDIDLAGQDLADLYRLVGLALPATPPYRLTGELDRNGRVLRLRNLRGRIGDSDVAGDASIDLRGARPRLEADLDSSRLDLDDLGGLLGLPPGIGRGETASPEQRAAAERRAASPRLLPRKEYDVRKLNAMDARVHLHADDVVAGKWPIDRLAMRLELENGVLRVDPLDVGLAGGRVVGSIELDARDPPIGARLRASLRRVDLEALFPEMQPPNIGRLNGRVELAGRGNSIAAMLASSDGSVMVGMSRGRVSNLLLELAGLDLAEALRFLVDDDTVPLRCAYGQFDVEDGLMKARSLVFDTTDTVIFGSGSVNLRQEALALEIRPEPKDVSPLSLRGPIEIGGTFKDPAFQPKAKPLLARAAAAAALYAIAPPAALLALVETGPGEDVDCHADRNKAGARSASKAGGDGTRVATSDDPR